MGKKKKRLLSKINPEKSNKMILAVVIGLVAVFSLFFFLLVRGGEPGNKKAYMDAALSYLRRTEGVLDVVVMAEQNRIKLVYDTLDRKDFRKIARYAGMKLSLKLRKETLEIQLFREKSSEPEYVVFFKDGLVLRESR